MTPEQLGQAWQDFRVWAAQPAPYTQAPWAAVLGLLLVGAIVLAATLLWGLPWARRWWTDETIGLNEDERGVSTVELTLQEHLLELRNRIVISLIALAVTTGVAAIFYRRWFDIAVAPIRGLGNCETISVDTATVTSAATAAVANGQKLCLQAITPTELVFAYFQLALVVGLIISMPLIAFQLWAYVAPG
ncbi:MAG: twin-arginine translocase subunit TatC, partial [Chloroflexota bacterium]|nr:twin-arginine translocase subunit TatC [Chloroflexota bacterium]